MTFTQAAAADGIAVAPHRSASGLSKAIGGCAGYLGAREELLQVADLAAAPIVKALLGKAVVPDRDPLTIGGLGLLGTAPSGDAMRECDTLLIAGSGFPYIDFYPKT